MMFTRWISLITVGVLSLGFSTAMAEEKWQQGAERGLSRLLEDIREERVSTGACGSPPRAPSQVSNRASKRFYTDIQSWDRCQRGKLDKLEDRVVDYQYRLDNWLPDLREGHPLIERSFRTIDVYNRRVGRARDRAAQDYEFLASAEADYADRTDTANRQASWALIEDDMRMSDICISETVAHFSPTSENVYECIERKKYEQSLINAGYSPYVPYHPDPHHDGYDHAKIVVNVHVDEAGSHPQN